MSDNLILQLLDAQMNPWRDNIGGCKINISRVFVFDSPSLEAVSSSVRRFGTFQPMNIWNQQRHRTDVSIPQLVIIALWRHQTRVVAELNYTLIVTCFRNNIVQLTPTLEAIFCCDIIIVRTITHRKYNICIRCEKLLLLVSCTPVHNNFAP